MKHTEETAYERRHRIEHHAKKPRLAHARGYYARQKNMHKWFAKTWRIRLEGMSKYYSLLTQVESCAEVFEVCRNVRRRDAYRAAALVVHFFNLECQFSNRENEVLHKTGWTQRGLKRSPYKRAVYNVARKHFGKLCRKRNAY